MADILVKICGINDPIAARTAVDAGADLIGFMFYPPSPRSITPEQAISLAVETDDRVIRVAVLVDADDATVDAVIASGAVDMLQLHGRETPERVTALKSRTGLPVMKALQVAESTDVAAAAQAGRSVSLVCCERVIAIGQLVFAPTWMRSRYKSSILSSIARRRRATCMPVGMMGTVPCC